MAESTERGYNFPCFKDKVIIITGASSGIGATTAIHFAKDGAKLALTGRNAERLNAVAQQCISQGIPQENVLQMTGDITDDAFVEKFVQETVAKLGGIDVLVNNAGRGEYSRPGVFDTEQLDRAYSLMVRSIYKMIKCCLPHLKESKGNIVNNSSILGILSSPLSMEYSICKSALTHLATNLVYELGEDGIRINTVSPGYIKTEIRTVENSQKLENIMRRKSALKRIGTTEEVASTIQFLASPAAAYVTGSDLLVDGGQTKVPLVAMEDFQSQSNQRRLSRI